MEPLRLELDEETSLRLQASSQTIKDDLESLQTKLLQQVRLFCAQKQREYVQYAKTRLYNAPQSPSSPRVPETPPKHIKSIVKRRASSAEKRVSFSRSPPHVELFKKIEEIPYDDDDEDENEAIIFSPTRSPTSQQSVIPKPPMTENRTDFKPSSPYLVFSRPTEVSVRQEPQDGQDDLFDFEDIIDSLESSRRNSQSSDEREPTANEPNDFPEKGASSVARLDTVEETGTLPSSNEEFLYVESDDSASPNKLSAETAAKNINTSNRSNQSSAQPFVGSAPVEIKVSQWGLEGDGGPPPRTMAMLEKEQNEQLSFSISRLALADSTDPSNMSFSQRMEWEQFGKFQHREVA